MLELLHTARCSKALQYAQVNFNERRVRLPMLSNMYTMTIFIVLGLVIIAVLAIMLLTRGNSGSSSVRHTQGLDDGGCSDKVTLGLNRLKPHFLNNILTTIYYLCDTDSEKAQSLTATFSEYLMNTLEALKADEPVSFAWELGLIRNYLAIEKVRLEDKLNVDYDVDINDFKVPPLSVLMLVESAVKRGIAGLDKPGTLRIATRRLAGGVIQIKVSDNGEPHESPNKRSEEEIKHDVQTVKRMLKQSCNGELEIKGMENGGTEATITMSPS